MRMRLAVSMMLAAIFNRRRRMVANSVCRRGCHFGIASCASDQLNRQLPAKFQGAAYGPVIKARMIGKRRGSSVEVPPMPGTSLSSARRSGMPSALRRCDRRSRP